MSLLIHNQHNKIIVILNIQKIFTLENIQNYIEILGVHQIRVIIIN